MNFLQKNCALSALFSSPKIGLDQPDLAVTQCDAAPYLPCLQRIIVVIAGFPTLNGLLRGFQKLLHSQMDSGKAAGRQAPDSRHFMKIIGKLGSNFVKVRDVFDACFRRIEFKQDIDFTTRFCGRSSPVWQCSSHNGET
jgi:hypothetical protein